VAAFYLTNKAVEDLDGIWEYTIVTWSEVQAENYYLSLMDSCESLAKKSNLGKSYENIGKGILGYKSGQHIIFYRTISDQEVEIIRILHGMMDLKNHL
jgi:toxin ParE1/3/4